MPGFAIPSCSSRTITYKGMLISPQLPRYFPDLQDERVVSRLALVHSRFSTNTFPSWELAHPYRMIAHNGEINTVRGNRNWMRAREAQISSPLFGDSLSDLGPVLDDQMSDSGSLDAAFELLDARRPLDGARGLDADPGGLPRARRAATAGQRLLRLPRLADRAVGRPGGGRVHRRHARSARRSTATACGPAAGCTPTTAGSSSRRRPACCRSPRRTSSARGALHPGKLFLVDLERERVIPDAELKRELAARQPYGDWLAERVVRIEDLPEKSPRVPRVEPLLARQLAFGWSQEDLRVLLAPMARDGVEPTGSMGNDTALAVLSDNRPPLFSYFKQLFAQVTNPAIDPIRESIVMSLQACVGPEINLLGETPDHCHQLVMPQPILRNAELEKLRQVDHEVFEARAIDITWPVRDGVGGMERRLERDLRRGVGRSSRTA